MPYKDPQAYRDWLERRRVNPKYIAQQKAMILRRALRKKGIQVEAPKKVKQTPAEKRLIRLAKYKRHIADKVFWERYKAWRRAHYASQSPFRESWTENRLKLVHVLDRLECEREQNRLLKEEYPEIYKQLKDTVKENPQDAINFFRRKVNLSIHSFIDRRNKALSYRDPEPELDEEPAHV